MTIDISKVILALKELIHLEYDLRVRNKQLLTAINNNHEINPQLKEEIIKLLIKVDHNRFATISKVENAYYSLINAHQRNLFLLSKKIIENLLVEWLTVTKEISQLEDPIKYKKQLIACNVDEGLIKRSAFTIENYRTFNERVKEAAAEYLKSFKLDNQEVE